MNEHFLNLYSSFLKISKIGFIRSPFNSKNCAGLLLEKLLNSTGGSFCVPDYNGIEIKAIRNNPNASFDLFNSAPDGNHFYASKWIADNYGYPDKIYKNIKVFKGDIYANKLKKIGLFYYFKLKTDKINQKIILEIYNSKKKLINNEIYWDFDTLKSKLYSKLNNLAIFDTEKKCINNNIYVHYKNINIYTLKDFNTFIYLLEKNYIYISFKTGVTKSGIYTGKFQDHGTSFKINKNHIDLLFNNITQQVVHDFSTK